MHDDLKGVLGSEQVTGEELRQACEHAALAALDDHRRVGEPVVTWDWVNHMVLLRSADEILAEADARLGTASSNAL